MSFEQFKQHEQTIKLQNEWRSSCINLIASENVLSRRVRDAMGSDFSHRYAEGHPGKRFYEGTKYIDVIEAKAREGVKEIFGCAQADVRPYAGNVANEAVFSRILNGLSDVVVNSTPGGGHISHHKVGSVGKFIKNIHNFPLSEDGYTIDVTKARALIEEVKPGAVILGKSLFLHKEPIADIAEICKKHGIILIYDAAHVLGLVAGGLFQQPLAEGADIMTGSVHKTFFGPQRGVVTSNWNDEKWQKIDKGVFPGSSSNHHLDTLAAFALCVEEWKAFGKAYARQVITNAKVFAEALASEGFDVQGKSFGYTMTHQVAVSVKDYGGGKNASVRLAQNNIVTNMNLLPYEPLKNVTNPDGIRLGVQEMTRMGMNEAEMKTIAKLMADCVIRGKTIQNEVVEFRNQFQVVRYSFDDQPE